MLTARASKLRDWGLFALAALAPALAVGALGLRALRNEEAAVRGEMAAALEASAERVAQTVDRAFDAARPALGALPIDDDAARAATQLRALCPAFAEPVVLGADRTLLSPAPPGDATRDAPPKCRELSERLRRPDSEAPASTGSTRAEFLSACAEARSATGRWLWPVVALGDPGAVPAEQLLAWLESRGPLLSAREREATRADLVAASIPEATRQRAVRALAAPGTRRDALRLLLGEEGARTAVRRVAPGAPDVAWRSGSSRGLLRLFDDGRLGGCVLHRAVLEEHIDAVALPSDQRAQVVQGAALRAAAEAAGSATAAAPSRLAVLAPDLGLRLVPADVEAVARRASRSRAVLAGLGVSATVLAFAVAGVLFARMRAARRLGALRTDFVSAVSHELRTPIASVRMLAELLEEDRVEPAERAEVHQALAREARRLGETVERLLGFSRMEAQRYVLARRIAPVADAVAASADTFEERNPDMPPLQRELDRSALASIDAAELRIAVDNLLANARKYAPDGGPYRVGVRRTGDEVEICVADHGPGIARRDQRRIFQPFERADDRLSRATEGSGIGLSLVRHVAEAHGGSARVESEPGKGAAFTIVLPAAREEP
jgi:signal transduction histidine kinase